MQFVSAIILALALAMGVQGSIVHWPWTHSEIAGHGLSYTAVTGPVWGHAPVWDPHASIAVHAPTWEAHVPAAVEVHAAPHIVLAPHAPVVVAAPAHEGTYVAKTRGAVHTAPLAGHANSVTAINAAPAPGTV